MRREMDDASDKETQTTSLRLPRAMWKELKLLAFHTDESLNQHILYAVSEYLKKEKIKTMLKTGIDEK